MKIYATLLICFLALPASAQLWVGSSGLSILSGTSITVDGLTLIPAKQLTLINNSLAKSSAPLSGNPSINRLYQFGTPILFSGTAGIHFLPSEQNGYSEQTLQLAYSDAPGSPLTVTEASTVNTTTHYVSNTLTDQTLFAVTATALADLSPILYARPSTLVGTKPISVVVDVFELNSVATSGTIQVKISKDTRMSLSFDPSATNVGGKPVNNSAWRFSGPAGGYYTLTTNQSIAAGDVVSLGLSGTVIPGATTGTLTVSSIVLASGLREAQFDNNTDADKIEYFQQ